MVRTAVNATSTTTYTTVYPGDGWTCTSTLGGATPYDQRLSDALDWAHWIEDHAEDLAGAKVAAGFAAWAIMDVVTGVGERQAA